MPIYDSNGVYSGFVGVDFDVQYYIAEESRFRAIAIGGIGAALILALVICYVVALYYTAMHSRMQDLYHRSIRDGLTGLLNRRGAMDAIKTRLARHEASYATLIVDIDNLKLINDSRGHVTVITRTAEAIRQSIRAGDACARFGGDEFVIFAPDCDADSATEIARTIVAKLSRPEMPLAGTKFSVSIGISVQDRANAEFARMFSDTDAALQQARTEGRSRIGLFTPSLAAFDRDRAASPDTIGYPPH
jgi:diguanylate cyclase (GGDEF)-like protein